MRDNLEEDADLKSGSPQRRRDAEASSSHDPSEGKSKGYVPKKGCYVCKGPYMMAKCPKLGSLSAMIQREDEEPRRLSTLEMVESASLEPRITYLRSMRVVEDDQPSTKVEQGRQAKEMGKVT